jgi:hypothetical protein
MVRSPVCGSCTNCTLMDAIRQRSYSHSDVSEQALTKLLIGLKATARSLGKQRIE